MTRFEENELKLHPCYCGGEMEIKKVAQNGGMDGTYWDWELTCKKCGLTLKYAADNFYGRKYKTFEEVIDDWNRKKKKEKIIKAESENIEPKGGYGVNNICTQKCCLKNHNIGIIECDEKYCSNRTKF